MNLFSIPSPHVTVNILGQQRIIIRMGLPLLRIIRLVPIQNITLEYLLNMDKGNNNNNNHLFALIKGCGPSRKGQTKTHRGNGGVH